MKSTDSLPSDKICLKIESFFFGFLLPSNRVKLLVVGGLLNYTDVFKNSRTQIENDEDLDNISKPGSYRTSSSVSEVPSCIVNVFVYGTGTQTVYQQEAYSNNMQLRKVRIKWYSNEWSAWTDI